MLLPIPPLRRRRSRRLDRESAPPAPPPPVVIVVVSRSGGNRFTWTFNQPFDDSNVDQWTAADFAGLTIDGTVPGAIDEVIGNDGTLTLVYPFDNAPSYHVVETPAVLLFANGATAIVPENGPVLP